LQQEHQLDNGPTVAGTVVTYPKFPGFVGSPAGLSALQFARGAQIPLRLRGWLAPGRTSEQTSMRLVLLRVPTWTPIHLSGGGPVSGRNCLPQGGESGVSPTAIRDTSAGHLSVGRKFSKFAKAEKPRRILLTFAAMNVRNIVVTLSQGSLSWVMVAKSKRFPSVRTRLCERHSRPAFPSRSAPGRRG